MAINSLTVVQQFPAKFASDVVDHVREHPNTTALMVGYNYERTLNILSRAVHAREALADFNYFPRSGIPFRHKTNGSIFRIHSAAVPFHPSGFRFNLVWIEVDGATVLSRRDFDTIAASCRKLEGGRGPIWIGTE